MKRYLLLRVESTPPGVTEGPEVNLSPETIAALDAAWSEAYGLSSSAEDPGGPEGSWIGTGEGGGGMGG